jgi:hypothetical protein
LRDLGAAWSRVALDIDRDAIGKGNQFRQLLLRYPAADSHDLRLTESRTGGSHFRLRHARHVSGGIVCGFLCDAVEPEDTRIEKRDAQKREHERQNDCHLDGNAASAGTTKQATTVFHGTPTQIDIQKF